MKKYIWTLFFLNLFFIANGQTGNNYETNCIKENCISKNTEVTILYNMSGDIKEALRLALEAKGDCLCSYGMDSAEYGISLYNLGIMYRVEEKKIELILPLLLEAEIIFKDKKSPFGQLHYSSVLTSLGGVYEDLADYEKSREAYTTAVDVVNKSIGKNNPYYRACAINLAGFYKISREYEKAIPLMIQVNSDLENSSGESDPQYVTGLNNLAEIYLDIGEYGKSEPLFKKAVELGKEVFGKTSVTYGVLLGNYGGFYMEKGEYQKALPVYVEAKEIQQNNFNGKHSRYASSLNNLAEMHKIIGNKKYALELLYESLEVWESVYGWDHPEYATSLMNLSRLLRKMGEYEEALPLLNKAGDIYKKLFGEEHIGYAAYLSDLGNLHSRMDDYDKALFYHLKARDVYGKISENKSINYIISLSKIAFVYDKMEEYEQAIKVYEEINDIRKKTVGANHTTYLLSLKNMAMLLYQKGNEKKAISIFKECILASAENVELHTSVMSEYATINYIRNKSVSLSGIQSMYLNSENKNNYKEVISESYNLSLLIQARGLQSNLNTRSTIFITKDSTLRQEYESLKILRSQYNKLVMMSLDERNIENINLENIKNRIIDIETKISLISKPFENNIEFRRKKIKFDDLSTILRNDEILIDFINFQYHDKKCQTDSILYAAYLTLPKSKYPIFIPLGEQKEIQALLKEPIGSKNGMSYIESEETGQELYKLIFAPLEKHLEGIKTIHISASGTLHKIAFHALQKGKGLLMDDYDIHYHGTMRDLFIQREQGETKMAKNMALFGNPDFNASLQDVETQGMYDVDSIWATRGNRAGFDPLPQTKIEIETIEKYARKNSWKTNSKIGISATEASFKSLSGKNIRVLHLATHGYALEQKKENREETIEIRNSERIARQKNPLFRSGLVFSGGNTTWKANTLPATEEDGLLTAYEISMMDLFDTDLVILSACNTGLGDIISGEGVFGLQRAFKTAGVKNLIVSLWEVDDKTTRLLMEKFYKHYFDGKNAHESLKSAQGEMREGEYGNARYWAGFVLVE